MAKKTIVINDPLEAVVHLRTALKLLIQTSAAFEEIVALAPRPELTRYRAALVTAGDVFNATEEYTRPSIADTLKPSEIGVALYTWFITNASFAERVQVRELKLRLRDFLNAQLERWPDPDARHRIARGFWDADDERFDNDAALGRDVKDLEDVLRGRFADAKPNSDCSLELWAHSAIVRLESTITEDRQIPDLLSAIDESNGLVTLEFISEGAAANFVLSTDPTVEYEELTHSQRVAVDNNRTIRNAEANESETHWKYAVGSIMRSATGFPDKLPIHSRLVAEDGKLWYRLGSSRHDMTTLSEQDLDYKWICIAKAPGAELEYKFKKNDRLIPRDPSRRGTNRLLRVIATQYNSTDSIRQYLIADSMVMNLNVLVSADELEGKYIRLPRPAREYAQ